MLVAAHAALDYEVLEGRCNDPFGDDSNEGLQKQKRLMGQEETTYMVEINQKNYDKMLCK